ncbi:hypothetical protein ACFX2B_040794 [Malus domestica]
MFNQFGATAEFSKQGVDNGVPDRHRRAPLRRSRRRQYRSSPRQQVRLREVRGSQTIARSHRPGLRSLQFLPSGCEECSVAVVGSEEARLLVFVALCSKASKRSIAVD